ncbi:MAG: hypothetical protein JXR58_02925 [Bacteroidales bacterium]|nr:hypothetical protein [Bacteroidales bacterium]
MNYFRKYTLPILLFLIFFGAKGQELYDFQKEWSKKTSESLKRDFDYDNVDSIRINELRRICDSSFSISRSKPIYYLHQMDTTIFEDFFESNYFIIEVFSDGLYCQRNSLFIQKEFKTINEYKYVRTGHNIDVSSKIDIKESLEEFVDSFLHSFEEKGGFLDDYGFITIIKKGKIYCYPLLFLYGSEIIVLKNRGLCY